MQWTSQGRAAEAKDVFSNVMLTKEEDLQSRGGGRSPSRKNICETDRKEPCRLGNEQAS